MRSDHPGRRDSLSLEESQPPTVTKTGVAGESHAVISTRGSSPPKRSASHMEADDTEMRESIETDLPTGTNATLSPEGNPDAPQSVSSAEMAAQDHTDGTTASTSIKSTSASVQPSSSTSLDSSPFRANAASNGSEAENDKRTDQMPSYDKQYADVFAMMTRPLKDGDTGYIVSNRWLERIIARTSDPRLDVDKSATEGEVGPVRNHDIQADVAPNNFLMDNGTPARRYIPLNPAASISENFEVVPEDAWTLIKQWYGVENDTTEMRRFAHETSEEGSFASNIQYELNPPILTLRRVKSNIPSAIQTTTDAAPRLVVSRSQKAQKFLTQAKAKLNIQRETKVKVWRVLPQTLPERPSTQDDSRAGMMTPPTSDDESPRTQTITRPKKFMDAADFEALEPNTHKAELEDLHDHSNDSNYNGSATTGLLGIGEDQTLIFEEVPASTQSKTFGAATKNLQAKKAQSSSGRASPTPTGVLTRGRAQRIGRGRGTVGLQNLGNTCYMNSALQCIRSVEELSQYFLSDKWREELNPSNPLGHSGNVAKVYASLVQTMYDSSTASSFAPRIFKQTLGRYAPMFSGYGQQDSQEFMSFLVDGLHEDLNRIHKKPYIENPESDDQTVGNPEAIRALGAKYQENHRARNDSIAMDLFNGFYKNTMVCPVCDKVSITFDPFSLLTLQLPFEQTWQHQIWFMPMYGPPICIDVDMNKNGSIRDLKKYVMDRIPGLKSEKMIVTEIFNNKFYKIFEDGAVISESSIQANDKIAVYELEEEPTNWPVKKKPSKSRSIYSYGTADSEEELEPSMAERMLVPIFHHAAGTTAYSSKNHALWPLFISLTPEEATDYDTILRKVLSRVGTLSTKKILEEEHIGFGKSHLAASKESSGVVTTEDDESSNTDPAVRTMLLDDESVVNESIVDESENGTENGDKVGTADTSARYRPAPPAVLEPGSFIPGQLQNLFTMKRFHVGKEVVPSGMTSHMDKTVPIVPRRHVEERRSSTGSSVSSADSQTSVSDADVDDPPETVNSYENNTPNDDDELPDVRDLVKSKGQNKHRFTNKNVAGHRQRTYGRKGKHNAASFAFDGGNEADDDDDDELVHLGDVIILDWSSAAMDTLFNGTADDEFRGRETLKVMETLDDPALRAKQGLRNARKKRGVTLDECFDETSKSEILSAENAWYCGRCKELRRASKTLEIWTLPEVLVIHLKRFGASRGFRDKLEVLVDFPIDELDLNQRIGLPEGKDHTYELIAVDNHQGGLGGGHYTAFAKNFLDQKWYDYNDSSVSSVSDPVRVVTPMAYLLFYRRRSSVPLGPPYLQDLVEASHKDEDEGTAGGDAENENETSRNVSPSGQGKGQRGGSYLNGNGSPSELVGAGVGLLEGSSAQTGLRGGRENPARTEDETMHDIDEGYSESGYIGPQQAPLNIAEMYAPLWNFNKLGPAEGDRDADEAGSVDATASDTAADADMDDLEERLLQEADDPNFEVPKITVSPDPYANAQADDPPTADIHLDENVESMLDNDAQDFSFKME